MTNNIQDIYPILINVVRPLLIIIFGILLGVFFDKIVLRWLKKLAERTVWEGDDIIVGALKRNAMLFIIIFSLYAVLFAIPLSDKISTIISKSLISVLIFIITLVISKISSGFLHIYSTRTHGVLPSTSIINNIIRSFVFLIGILIILRFLGIPITPILTALGVGGLAVALALQETLSNLFAGIHIIASKHVQVDDYVKLDTGEEGYVIDITWRNTTIKTIQNNVIVIPNSKLTSTIITNYFLAEAEMSLFIPVGVSYESDLEKVEEITLEVAQQVLKEHPGAVTDFEPKIRYHTFSDFSINFNVILRIREFAEQYLIQHDFIKILHKRYKKEGIEIPFPIRTVYMKNQM